MSISDTQTIETIAATALPAAKAVVEVKKPPQGHWVGDGFPVRTIFHYGEVHATTPFILMDYAGPLNFTPATQRRGVGEHPHRGFETVTIVFSGEVEHRDSAGGGGKIGPGDVQWMTAGSGLVHEEMHSKAFTESGGLFEAIQLWVNLPARLKMTKPKYQTIVASDIPEVKIADGGGTLRIIAGTYEGAAGPADTFTPINLWDGRLKAGHGAMVRLPSGHTASVFVMKGRVSINGKTIVGEAELAVLGRDGEAFRIDAEADAHFAVLSGEPIDEPVAGYGPFVMNTQDELRQAVADYQSGRMGHLGA